MNILVTDASYANALAVVRECGHAGHRVFTMGVQADELCAYSKFCVKHVVFPSYTNEACLPQLLLFLRENAIDLIIPVSAASVHFFVEIQPHLPQSVSCILPSKESLSVCHDRQKLVAVAHKVGVPVPTTWFFDSYEEFQTTKSELSFPLVIKSRWESSGKIPVVYANSIEECEQFFQGKIFKQWMLQQYVEGRGAGFFALYDSGKCGPTFQHQRLREYPYTGGISTAASSIRNDQLLDYGKKLLDELQWNGVAMVEFKWTGDDFYLIEINPKFWGSLDLSLYCGVSFPLYLIELAQKKTLAFSTKYTLRKFHWPLLDIKHLKQNPSSFWSVFWDFFSFTTGSNLIKYGDMAFFKRAISRGIR